METRAPSTWAPLASSTVPLMLPAVCWSGAMKPEDCGLEDCRPGASGSSKLAGSNAAIWMRGGGDVIGLEGDGRESVCACAWVLSDVHSRMVKRKGPGFRKPCISATSSNCRCSCGWPHGNTVCGADCADVMNLGLWTASATITHQSDQSILAVRNFGSVNFYSSYRRVVVVRSPIIFLRVAGRC